MSATTVVEVRPIIDSAVQRLCYRPYPRHPKGCPNFGHKSGCPPTAPLLDELFDCSQPVFAIVSEFDLGSHVEMMRAKHPEWTEAQCECVLYWQPRARSVHKADVRAFLRAHLGYHGVACPEAMGVNVTQTLSNAGVVLEWPPRRIARQVTLAVRRLHGQHD